jgi:Undecaprenyl-phosphate glucose phosphotransferase
MISVVDIFAITCAYWISHPKDRSWTAGDAAAICLTVAIVIVIMARHGLYNPFPAILRRIRAVALFLASLTLAAYVSLALTAAAALTPGVLSSRASLLPSFINMPFHVLDLLATLSIFLFAGRLAFFAALPRRWLSLAAPRAVIIGDELHAQRFLRSLDADQHTNSTALQVIGLVPWGIEDEAVFERIGDYPLISGLDGLTQKIDNNEVDVVVLALSEQDRQGAQHLINRLLQTPVEIRMTLDIHEAKANSISRIGNLFVVHLRDRPISGISIVIKQAADLVLATLMLLLFGPLMLLIAVAIKLDSPGPVIFSQYRYGIGNRLIYVRKFRTMFVEQEDPKCLQQTIRNDPRLTRIGQVLRRYSLDELPQIFNVLLGEMSVVGPRPHAVGTTAAGLPFERAVANYMARHQVKPGITGWAQVKGFRGETDSVEKLARRVECDLFYIDNWSLWLDIRIVMMTARCLVGDANAF